MLEQVPAWVSDSSASVVKCNTCPNTKTIKPVRTDFCFFVVDGKLRLRRVPATDKNDIKSRETR